jgi:hypothetical protein
LRGRKGEVGMERVVVGWEEKERRREEGGREEKH